MLKKLSVAAQESQFEQTLTDYWRKFGIGTDTMGIGHCSFCGNRGIIDSRSITTPAGQVCGRLNWCICPNGQTMRRQTKQMFPDEAQWDRAR